MTATNGLHVAYIMSRFPHLPETFVLREMDALEGLGRFTILLAPLLRQRDPVVHPAAARWVERALYTPLLSPALLRSLVSRVWRQPEAARHALRTPLRRVTTTPNLLAGTLGIAAKAAHLADRFEAAGVQHIHAHFATHPAMAAYMINQWTGIPYSFTAHAHDIYVHQAMLREKMRAASFVVTISDHNRRLLEAVAPDTQVEVIRSGVTPERYGIRCQSDPPVIVAVGSLQDYKGHRHLIDACARLRGMVDEEFRCVIVGGGRLHGRLQRRIDDLGLRSTVRLAGPRPEAEVARHLAEATVLAMPSVAMPDGKMEGLPVVLVEALASQLPVVASDLSGIPELVHDRQTGLLVPPGDAACLADALAWVLTHPEEARALGRRGRRLVERRHDLRSNVAELGRLIEGVAA